MRFPISIVVAISLAATVAAQRSVIHPESSFRPEVRRLLAGEPALSARAYHNDLEIWVKQELTAVLGALNCDRQRDYAASIWLRWNDMGVGAGAGVTIKSYTGRTLASAEQGFSGPQFHC